MLFTGIMVSTIYTDILSAALLPFLAAKFPAGHRFQQDNDPKHTSHYTQDFLTNNNVNWWKTPASSPDLNPIENVWGSMKTFLRKEVKPHNLGEVKAGIRRFWKTLTPAVCKKYIGHLRRVVPKVIQEDGGPTGF